MLTHQQIAGIIESHRTKTKKEQISILVSFGVLGVSA